MVDETDIGAVRPGNQATFITEAYPAREFTGAVRRVAPKATIVSGVVNYEVEIKINGGLDLLKPDMTPNVTINTSQREALVAPNGAIRREDDERFVYVEKDGRLEKRPVVIGVRDLGFTEIKKGLTRSDRVAVSDLPPADKKD
jgi:HlyD family secretion protein